MNVRPYESSDESRVKELLALQPFEYEMSPLDDSKVITRIAVLNGKDVPVVFGFSRLITESFLLLDHKWGTPGFRWDALKAAHAATVDMTVAQGIDKAATWVPVEIAKSYGRRLASLGWEHQARPSYVYTVKT